MMARTLTCVVMLLVAAGAATAKEPGTQRAETAKLLPDLESPSGVSTALQWVLWITVISVAPAIVIMVTCFTRIVVVLGLLRQALTTQNMPPNQVLFGLAIFMTLVVMAPVYTEVYDKAISPCVSGQMSSRDALAAGRVPVRTFMIEQIDSGGNSADVELFLDKQTAAKEDLTWGDVPTLSLIPAFVVSELKIAFMMGFRIFLPFLIIDMLVSSVLVSMGMLMLPPVLISLPFKLLLFVLADGWHLVVGTLMRSFG